MSVLPTTLSTVLGWPAEIFSPMTKTFFAVVLRLLAFRKYVRLVSPREELPR